MDTQNKRTEINRRFSEWLAGVFIYAADGYHNTLFRVQKNDDFDYLYCQKQYQGSGIRRRDKFEYAGIYYKADGLVYDVGYNIQNLMAEDDEYATRSPESLTKRLEFHVRRAVEKMVNNDRGNLRVTELQSEREIRQMEEFKMYTAPKNARDWLLENDGDFSFVYECRYEPANWTEDSLLSYISDPDGYAETEAAVYFDNNQEDILFDFIMGDMVAAEYGKLINNPLLPVHRVKRIMQAIRPTSAKTVSVTVCINGVELTFKTEAKALRYDCATYYSNYDILAADRREFMRVYGRNANYKPEDILRIEYARSILYSADTDTTN